VLLGGLGPVQDVWRPGSSLVEVTPAHASTLARRVLRFAEWVGEQGASRNQPVADWARHVCDELDQRRWLPDRAERVPRGIGRAVRNLVGVMLPDLVAEARQPAPTPPEPISASDEPVSALDDLTMREAAAREEYADRLEVFLRELEHHQVPTVIDVRRELGLV